MISHKKKFIFIHIPGTAGTSIEHALEEYQSGKLINQGGGIWRADEETTLMIKEILGKEVSLNPKHIAAKDWKKVLGKKYKDYYKFTVVRNPIDKAVSLYKFNKKLPSHQPKWVINQSMFITDEKNNIIIDDIFKFENLEEDWKKLCNKLNIKYKPLPHKNNRNPKKESVDKIFPEKEINYIQNTLKDDFNLLGY